MNAIVRCLIVFFGSAVVVAAQTAGWPVETRNIPGGTQVKLYVALQGATGDGLSWSRLNCYPQQVEGPSPGYKDGYCNLTWGSPGLRAVTPGVPEVFINNIVVLVPTGELWKFWQETKSWVSAGGESPWDTRTFQVRGTAGTGEPMNPGAATKFITFDLPANASPNPVKWQIFNTCDNTIPGYKEIPPGGGAQSWGVEVPQSTDAACLKLRFFIPSLKFDTNGGTWYSTTTPGTETVFDAPNIPPITSSNFTQPGAVPTSAQKIAVPVPSPLPSTAVNPTKTGGTVWINAPAGSALSDTTFREGVDKIVAAEKEGNASLAKIAGWGEGTFNVGNAANAAKAAKDAQPAYSGVQVSGAVTASAPPGSHATLWQQNFPGGQVVRLSFADLATSLAPGDVMMIAGRALISLVMVVWFARSTAQDVKDFVIGSTSITTIQIAPAVENMVPGMSQGKAIAIAATTVTAIFTAMAAIVAVVDTVLSARGAGLTSINVIASGTNWSFLGEGLKIVDRYFPTAVAIELGILRALVPYLMIPAFTVVCLVIKFLYF